MRDQAGKWLKGVTGNPGGKCKRVRELLEFAREETKASFEYVRDVRDDPDEDSRVRLDAARILIAYGVGAPPKTEALLAAELDHDAPEATDDDLTLEEKRALARQAIAAEPTEEDDDADESPAH